jgi:hypothetical protein
VMRNKRAEFSAEFNAGREDVRIPEKKKEL